MLPLEPGYGRTSPVCWTGGWASLLSSGTGTPPGFDSAHCQSSTAALPRGELPGAWEAPSATCIVFNGDERGVQLISGFVERKADELGGVVGAACHDMEDSFHNRSLLCSGELLE